LEWISGGIHASFAERNYVWGRFENVDRTNELLLLNRFEPPTFEENIIGRLQGYTAGYEHDLDLIPHLATGRMTVVSHSAQTVFLAGWNCDC
jgi:hypothetical protein